MAGRKSKMARGRKKQLNRMERMENPDVTENRPCFNFSRLPVTNADHLSVRLLSVGYQYPLLSGLQFSAKGGQKIVITGFNGIGKSTLLKTLTNQIPALDVIFRTGHHRILWTGSNMGWYNQDTATDRVWLLSLSPNQKSTAASCAVRNFQLSCRTGDRIIERRWTVQGKVMPADTKTM